LHFSLRSSSKSFEQLQVCKAGRGEEHITTMKQYVIGNKTNIGKFMLSSSTLNSASSAKHLNSLFGLVFDSRAHFMQIFNSTFQLEAFFYGKIK
jgi:hypothetical protein